VEFKFKPVGDRLLLIFDSDLLCDVSENLQSALLDVISNQKKHIILA
jgi:hypothetical protein